MTRDTAERARAFGRRRKGDLYWTEKAEKELVAEYTKIQSEAREQLAAWMIEHSFSTGHGDTFEDLLKELDWQVKELRGARLEEARWWKLQIESRIQGINFYQHMNFDVADKIELERIAALAQALQPEEKEGSDGG